MEKIQHIRKSLQNSISGKQAVLLFTGDKGSALLMNIIGDMNVHTVFIDTGFHFDEVVTYTKKIADKIEIVKNHNTAIDSSIDMQKCCNERKREVLIEYLSKVRAECLIVPFTDEEKKSGIEDSYVNGIENIEIVRPLNDLSDRDVWLSIRENKIPVSSIYNKGFRVVDCKCCTTRTGRKRPDEEQKRSDFDRETVEKLKSLGYM